MMFDKKPRLPQQTCDACSRTETKPNKSAVPDGWMQHAITLSDGRVWSATFCPECQKDLERSSQRALESVDN